MHCATCGSATEDDPCTACGGAARLQGRWELRDMVGRGAHGTTWRAIDPSTGVVRAVKELPLRLGLPDKTVQLFRREADVLQQLDHPGLPACHAAFETGTGRQRTLWIVQDFVEGDNLERELRGRRYDEDQVLAVVEELLCTLVYLHGVSPPVVHRDIKPANVLRTPDDRLVLVDFGSVRDALRDPDLGGSTVAGTFGYMAPEQFAGDAEPRTDLYGVGALAVALLTRKPPHTLQDARGTLHWRAHASVSPATAALLDDLLAAEIIDRPKSAAIALDRVRAIRAGEPLEPPEPVPTPNIATADSAETDTWGLGGELTLEPVDPKVRGGSIRLGGTGLRLMTETDRARAVAVIERDLGMQGSVDSVGGALRWRSNPATGRVVQVMLEPAGSGTNITVTEDLRGLWGSMLGGIGGGLGGGLGGSLGWIPFVQGDVVGGIGFIAAVVVGALMLGTTIARVVQNRRVEQLDDLVESLQKGFGGQAVARPPLPRLASSWQSTIAAVVSGVIAMNVMLGLATGDGLGLWPMFGFIFVFFGFFRGRGSPRSQRRSERAEARERQKSHGIRRSHQTHRDRHRERHRHHRENGERASQRGRELGERGRSLGEELREAGDEIRRELEGIGDELRREFESEFGGKDAADEAEEPVTGVDELRRLKDLIDDWESEEERRERARKGKEKQRS